MGAFTKVIEGIFGGALAYYISNIVFDLLIEGTGLADEIFLVLVPVAIGVGTLLYILGVLRPNNTQQ